MTILARAPGPAELLIIALLVLIPLAALVIGFLVLMRITGPPKSNPDDPDPAPLDSSADKDP